MISSIYTDYQWGDPVGLSFSQLCAYRHVIKPTDCISNRKKPQNSIGRAGNSSDNYQSSLITMQCQPQQKRQRLNCEPESLSMDVTEKRMFFYLDTVDFSLLQTCSVNKLAIIHQDLLFSPLLRTGICLLQFGMQRP